MKILVFYPYIPYPIDRGTYQRTFHLLRELAREHTVDLLALDENGERAEHRAIFEAFCGRVEFVSFQHPQWAKLFPDSKADDRLTWTKYRKETFDNLVAHIRMTGAELKTVILTHLQHDSHGLISLSGMRVRAQCGKSGVGKNSSGHGG